MKLKQTLLLGSLALIMQVASAAPNPLMLGNWRTIDDKTGFTKAIAEVKQESDGSYSATVIRVVPRPGYTPKELCQDCPPPFTNKPIIGLKIMWGLKPDPNRDNAFVDGHILDPLNGKVYKAKARVTPDGRHLAIRAYIGISAIGRTPIWIRDGSEIGTDGLGRMPTAQ
jgi:uncharacterized protein (DUF2147 family)